MQFTCIIRDKSTSNCAFYDTLCTQIRTKVRVKVAKVGNKMKPKVVVLLPFLI
jgi:hypothetical protein